MAETVDIAIIGAGIIGLCTAFQLAKRSNARIVVLEKGIGLGEGSTGASSAVCRYKYTQPNMVQLAKDGISAYQNWASFLELETAVGKYHRDGVLWLSDGRTEWQESEAARLTLLGVTTAVLCDQELRDRFPSINPCPIPPNFLTAAEHDCEAGGNHLLELDGGYFDPMDALHDLTIALRARNVDFRFGAKVTACQNLGGAVSSLTLASGDVINCGVLVCAAGPWCNEIYQQLGLNAGWQLKPTRIQAFHVDRPATVKGHIPVTADSSGGIYFRMQNQGQQIVVSSVLEEDEKETIDEPNNCPTFADDEYIQHKLFALQHRLYGLDKLTGVRGYSGLYTINQADVHPVVGATPIKGFYVANGFSGHGFKLAPAIGSLLAREITGDRADFDTEVDRTFLAFDRQPIHIKSKSVLA